MPSRETTRRPKDGSRPPSRPKNARKPPSGWWMHNGCIRKPWKPPSDRSGLSRLRLVVAAVLFQFFPGHAQRFFHLPPLGHVDEGGDHPVDLVVDGAVGANARQVPATLAAADLP